MKFINLDLFVLIQKNATAAECVMIKRKLFMNVEEIIDQLSASYQ